MPSTVSTTAMIQWLRTDAIDLDVLSVLIGALFGDALNTLARRRDDGSLPGEYGDVRFHELMADPVEAIAAAYAGIGREMTDEHRAAVVRYLEHKPRGKHGTHRYSAAEWGFDADVLRADLGPSMARFGVAVEDE
jgi:hypothetical protein